MGFIVTDITSKKRACPQNSTVRPYSHNNLMFIYFTYCALPYEPVLNVVGSYHLYPAAGAAHGSSCGSVRCGRSFDRKQACCRIQCQSWHLCQTGVALFDREPFHSIHKERCIIHFFESIIGLLGSTCLFTQIFRSARLLQVKSHR